jgi:hypothetical protein
MASDHFPSGPEAVAAHLGVQVEYNPLVGCDGWCLRAGDRAIIQINDSVTKVRQRFTLAHELAHLILGTSPSVARPFYELLGSDQREERAANELAAALLAPRDWLKGVITSLPVDAKTLRKAATEANVSQLMLACRVTSLATELGLRNGAVVVFNDGEVQWVWSPSLRVDNSKMPKVLEEARACAPQILRRHQKGGQIGTASLLESRYVTALFLQLLPPELALTKTVNERIRELQQSLFRNDKSFLNIFNGQISTLFQSLPRTTRPDSALEAFKKRYFHRYDPNRLAMLESDEGREYLRLRFETKFPHR